MSGIAGEILFSEKFSEQCKELSKMGGAIRHRGSFHGDYTTEHAALYQGSARQNKADFKLPLRLWKNETEYTIVFDGLIYNKKELKEILLERSCRFETETDEEIVLKAYFEFGADCLKIINGAFALAIWDNKSESLFIARDRFGIKPFFYSVLDNGFIFGSEIKALFASGRIKPKINLESILEIMLIGPGRTLGYGVFEGVFELLPATYGYFTRDGLKLCKYWTLYPHEHTDTPEQTAEKVRFLVDDSIKSQSEADTPICTMLSGGLDSSIISSVVAKALARQGKTLDTYTVTYTDNDKYFTRSKFQPNNDSEFIGIINNYLNAQNHIIEIDHKSLVSALFSAVEARDLPGMADVDSSLLLFSKAIAKDYKIVLSGECSDEIFAGYPWYREPALRNADSFPWARSTTYRQSFLTDEIRNAVDAEGFVHKKYENTLKQAMKLNTIDSDERTKELMKLNLDWFMMTLVDRSDRMSAFNSLDIRVPFCDYRIVEYLYSVPLEIKDYNGFEKGILRKAYSDMLPKEILWRKKSPYPKTHNPIYLSLVRAELEKILQDETSPIFEFVSKQALNALLLENSSQRFYGQLMTTPQTIAYFVQINYWLKKYNIEIDL